MTAPDEYPMKAILELGHEALNSATYVSKFMICVPLALRQSLNLGYQVEEGIAYTLVNCAGHQLFALRANLNFVVRNRDKIGIRDHGSDVVCEGTQPSDGCGDSRIGTTTSNDVKGRTIGDSLSCCQRCRFVLVDDCSRDTAYGERAAEELVEHGEVDGEVFRRRADRAIIMKIGRCSDATSSNMQ